MISLALFAQAPDGKGKAKAPPKNLKILTPETYRPLMDVFVSSLGLADKDAKREAAELIKRAGISS